MILNQIDRQQPGVRLQPDSGTNRTDLALIGYGGVTTTKAVKLRREGYTRWSNAIKVDYGGRSCSSFR